MRTWLSLLFTIILFTTQAQSTANKEVEQAVLDLNNALIARDRAALEKLVTNELSYGHSTGVVQNKTEFLNDATTMALKFSKIEVSNETTSVTGDLAIARLNLVLTGTNNEAAVEIKISVLMVWKKEDRHWKLLARQGYKVPPPDTQTK